MDWEQRRILKAREDLMYERQMQRHQRDLRRALDSSNRSLARQQCLQ